MGYQVKVNNVPSEHDRYIVARLCMGELWYWGSWSTLDAATRVIKENNFENGIVVEECGCRIGAE